MTKNSHILLRAKYSVYTIFSILFEIPENTLFLMGILFFLNRLIFSVIGIICDYPRANCEGDKEFL